MIQMEKILSELKRENIRNMRKRYEQNPIKGGVARTE